MREWATRLMSAVSSSMVARSSVEVVALEAADDVEVDAGAGAASSASVSSVTGAKPKAAWNGVMPMER
jgi:hypothetical protein